MGSAEVDADLLSQLNRINAESTKFRVAALSAQT